MSFKCRTCPIRQKSAFVPMSEEDIEMMQRFKVGELKVEAGTPLLMEGSGSAQLFTVISGQGVRYKTLTNGRRQVINFVFPGDFLGLQAAVMSEMQHAAESVTQMVLCVFDRSGFFSFVTRCPERAYDMIWLSAVEEHFLGEDLATLGQRRAEERLAWAFLTIWHRLDSLGLKQGGAVPLPHRQQDLADALGLSLVHTNKTLGKLRDRQVLSWENGKLMLHDLKAVRRIAQLPEDYDMPARPLF